MTTDGKYIVFKKSDFVRIRQRIEPSAGADFNALADLVLDDAVVIRRGDVFAPPALDMYASSIQVTIEGMKTLPMTLENDRAIRRLQSIADYFHAQAVEAWATHRKLPD